MATTKFIDIKVRSSSAERNVDSLDNKMKGLGRTTDDTTSSFGKLSRIATAIGSAIATAQITKYADAYTSLQNQIRQTVNSTADLEKRTQQLLDVSNRSRAGISETADLYTQLVLSTESLNLSTEENLRLTETITKSFAVSGKTAAESAGAIRQLGQALGSGALRGDEFNSIAEGAPEILRALQRELGKSAGELREFAATGGITAEVLVKALTNAATVIDDKLNNSVATFAQNAEIANNNLTEFIGSSSTVQSVIGGAGEAFVTASENLETIVDLFTVGATVLAARLIPQTLAYTASLAANTSAQLLNGTTATRTVNIYGVVTTQAAKATVATNALTASSRLLSASMAFLGGPLGVALVAAAALVTFSNNSIDAGDNAALSAVEVDKLTESFKGMSRAAKAAELSSINLQMEALRVELTLATEKADRLSASASSAAGTFGAEGLATQANFAKQKVKELNQELSILSEKQGVLIGGPDLSGGTDRGNINNTPTESATGPSKFVQNLKLETEALQKELEIRKLVSDGFLLEEEANEIIRFSNAQMQAEARLQSELLRLGDNEAAKAELLAASRENVLLATQEFQLNLTEIENQGLQERLDLQENAAETEINLRNSVTSNAVNLLQVLGRESKAASLLGIAIAKAQALSANAVATGAAATLAFASQLIPGDPTSIGRAYAAAGAAKSLGALNAGLIIATGIAQGASVLSGGSGSTGVTNAGTGSFSTSSSQPVEQQSVARQTRAVEIRTDGSAFAEAVKEAALSVIDSDDDVVLNITNKQQELVRIGA